MYTKIKEAMNLISASSTETRVPKVAVKRQARQANGRLKTQNSLVPAHQAGKRQHRPCVYTQAFRGVPSNLFQGGNGSKCCGRLESGAFHRVNAGGVVKIDVTLSAANPLVAAWNFFDRISFRSAGGSSHVTTIHADQLAFMLNEYNDAQLANILPLANASATWGPAAATAAGSHSFYLPLSKSFLEGLFMDDMSRTY